MLKKILFIPVVIIIVVGVDLAWRHVADIAFANVPDNMYADFSYKSYNGNDQVIILGASRAQHHYNCQMISDSLNLSCRNMGLDGYGLAQQYMTFLNVINNDSLKYVILDISPYQLQHALGGRGDDASIFIPYYWKDDTVKKIVDDNCGDFSNLKYLSSLYQFNQKAFTIANILYNRKKVFYDPNNGYLPIPYTGSINTDHGSQEYNSFIPDKYCKKLLDNMSLMSIKRHVKLFVVVSPVDENWQDFTNWLQDYCNYQNVCFKNFADNIAFVSNQKLFKDRHHLNERGAKLFSNMLIKDILQQGKYAKN